MEDIHLDFTIEYAAELSPSETLPMVAIYMDTGVENDPVEIKLPLGRADRQLSAPIRVSLSGKYSKKKPLPLYTKLVFYVTCSKNNKTGAPCRVDAGFGMLTLFDMMNQPISYQKDVLLKLYSCQKFEKGVIRVKRGPALIRVNSNIQWANAQIGRSLRMRSSLPRIETMKLEEDDKPLPVELEAMAYVKKVMAIEKSFPNTDPETANVRVPIYYGDVGMTRKIPLPAAAFLLYTTPKSNLLYWTNIARVCLRRDGRNIHDVLGMKLAQRGRLMVEMCTALVQALDYIGDFLDTNKRYSQRARAFFEGDDSNLKFDPRKVNGCERFGDALRDETGDCEDLALAIMMIFFAFLSAGNQGMFDAPELAYLKELHRIAVQYVPFLTLDSVTAAAVKINAERGHRKLGAHMAVKFLPAIYVKECIERSPASREEKDALKFQPFSDDARDLPVFMGEGTGMLECYGIDYDPIAGERACVFTQMSSLKFCKKDIIGKPGARSSFYNSMELGFTNYWVFWHNINVMGIWLGYYGRHTNPQVGPPGKFQRGVEFVDLENKRPNVSIYPHPVFSDRVMEWMHIATRIRVKPRDLILTQKGLNRLPVSNPNLDAIVAYTKSLNRRCMVPQDPVPVYIRDYQLTPQVMAALREDIRKHAFVSGLTYRLEPLTDRAYTYRMGIHANAK